MADTTLQVVRLQNFGSYGNVLTEVILDTPGITTIHGRDADNATHGTSSNGTGKSTIANAICYALYGKSLTKTTLDRLINNINQRNLRVELDFTDGQNQYRIVRTRRNKTSGDLYLYVNGEDVTAAKDPTQAIQDIIGIPHEVFCRIGLFSASHVPFLVLPSATQTEMMALLLNITALHSRADNTKAAAKRLKTESTKEEQRITGLQEEHARHAQRIERARAQETDWAAKHATQLAACGELPDVIYDPTEYATAHEEYTTVASAATACVSNANVITGALDRLEQTLTQLEKEHNHLKSSVCPYCSQHLDNAAIRMSQVKTKIATYAVEHMKLCTEQTSNAVKLGELQAMLPSLKVVVREANDRQQLATKHAEHATLRTAVNPYAVQVTSLEAEELPEITSDELDRIAHRLKHAEFLHKLLSRDDSFVRQHIINQYLGVLNSRLSHYCDHLGLPHSVKFLSSLDVDITLRGNGLDYGTLSAGQRARVNLALSFAFRDIFSVVHGSLNFFMLDECLDVGLDGVGVHAAIRAIKEYVNDNPTTALFLISHREEIGTLNRRQLHVEMSGGFSTIRASE